jgi:pyrroloquinoline quinone (PQQ) biosynthesis protein C
MTTISASSDLLDQLTVNEARKQFEKHEFFKSVSTGDYSFENVGVFLGQWWHPLHYFPTFLARCVSVLPDIRSKSAITKILDHETGHGRVHRAHEVIFVESLVRIGFTEDTLTNLSPFPSTAALLEGYERQSADALSALGGIYATEVSDLLMVSSIGSAVERVTGEQKNAWVAVHVNQEPDHVEEAGNAMLVGFTVAQEDVILRNATEMWELWSGFFDSLLESWK